MPSATIVVSTLGRLPHLRRLIDTLGHLVDDDFELIIVVGPSDDGTSAFLEQCGRPIKVISCAEANLSLSRNLGVAQATGEIIAFIDDDAVPLRSDWLATYRQYFGTNAKCGAAGALVINSRGQTEFYRGSTSEYAEQCDFGVKPASGSRVVPGVMGCNFAARASALREIGGFDECLAYYLDETDVCFRLAAKGYTIDFVEDNAVVHFSAQGAFRRDPLHRGWRTISRSDTHFCMRHGRDPVIRRIVTTLRVAPWKHFLHLLLHGQDTRRLRRRSVIGYVCFSILGLIEGLWSGLSPARGRPMPPVATSARILFRAVPSKRKLRIGLISRTLPGTGGYGGPGQHTDTLAKALYQRGHAIHVFCLAEQPGCSWVDFQIHAAPTSAEDSGFYESRVPSVSQRLSTATAYWRMIEQVARDGKPLDVVIASNWDLEAITVIRAGTCPVALYAVTPLAINLEMGLPGFERSDDLFLWNSLDRWQILNASIILAPSHGVLPTYERLLDIKTVDLPNLAVVPLGVTRTFLPTPSVDSKRPRLLFVGRLEKRKGIQTLLAILPALLAEFPDWGCHIVGEDRLPFANGLPIKDTFLASTRASLLRRVTFVGYCTETQLHDEYRRCDILVVPALYESFGLVYQEAMQYGKPVVACDAGGLGETIEADVEGILVAPADETALQTALRTLMRDPTLRQRMGQAGAERIVHRNNAVVFARDVERQLFKVLERSAVAEITRQTNDERAS